MIEVNNKKYHCINFEHHIVIDGCEHLHIFLEGELDNNRRLQIKYKDVYFYGHKVIYNYRNNISEIIVYIFQEGDTEL